MDSIWINAGSFLIGQMMTSQRDAKTSGNGMVNEVQEKYVFWEYHGFG